MIFFFTGLGPICTINSGKFQPLLGKTIFTKPRINHVPLLQRCKASFNSRQVFAFKELYLWRNKLARTEDESENYVLPTHMLIKIRLAIS